MIRGDELAVRGCEFLSGSIEQNVKGDLHPSPSFAGVLLHYIVLFGQFWSYTC